MKSKSQVIAKAKKLGCTLLIDRREATLLSPDGYKLRGMVHYSVFEFDRDYSRGEIWDGFYDEMSGMYKCEEQCCNS